MSKKRGRSLNILRRTFDISVTDLASRELDVAGCDSPSERAQRRRRRSLIKSRERAKQLEQRLSAQQFLATYQLPPIPVTPPKGLPSGSPSGSGISFDTVSRHTLGTSASAVTSSTMSNNNNTMPVSASSREPTMPSSSPTSSTWQHVTDPSNGYSQQVDDACIIHEMSEENAELRSEVEQANAEIDRVRSELEKAKRERFEAEHASAKLHNTKVKADPDLIDRIHQLELQNRRLADEAQRVKVEPEVADQYEALKREHKELKSKLNQDNHASKFRLEALEKANKEYVTQLRDRENRIASGTAELERLREREKTITAERLSLKTEVDNLRVIALKSPGSQIVVDKVNRLEKQIRTLDEGRHDMSKRISNQRNQLSTLQSALSKEKRIADEFHSESVIHKLKFESANEKLVMLNPGRSSLAEPPKLAVIKLDCLIDDGDVDYDPEVRRYMNNAKYVTDRIRHLHSASVSSMTKYSFQNSDVYGRITKLWECRRKWRTELAESLGAEAPHYLDAAWDVALKLAQWKWRLPFCDRPRSTGDSPCYKDGGLLEPAMNAKIKSALCNHILGTSLTDAWTRLYSDDHGNVRDHWYQGTVGVLLFLFERAYDPEMRVTDGNGFNIKSREYLNQLVIHPKFIGRLLVEESKNWCLMVRNIYSLLGHLDGELEEVYQVIKGLASARSDFEYRAKIHPHLMHLERKFVGPIGLVDIVADLKFFEKNIIDEIVCCRISTGSFTVDDMYKAAKKTTIDKTGGPSGPPQIKAQQFKLAKAEARTGEDKTFNVSFPRYPYESQPLWAKLCVGERATHKVVRNQNPHAEPCSEFADGKCNLGINCPKSHTMYMGFNHGKDGPDKQCWNSGAFGHTISFCNCSMPSENKMKPRKKRSANPSPPGEEGP